MYITIYQSGWSSSAAEEAGVCTRNACNLYEWQRYLYVGNTYSCEACRLTRRLRYVV
jgi:hypothetical protein